ncbi:4-hydroxy-tetrahydrodipicolinate reductase [Natranaerofaba carboxydovora]|uniref:4-hydroxy-tetrahydrodipicolinate reductase n=1 Tax=Natranaerofaba carboxydovora TaxID=2742683 RepID=UPI001F12D3E9|nr:4-hydroxy-tetrahydrodipicolinate reductase [Natranaerofaba carboxydovora]UMZ73439.1 4-hydroxy-tetrahydrodipicolinate reductase [Natranaerofaba carboxydovora]
MEEIKVAVSGANGRMGQEVCRTVLSEDNLKLIAAFDRHGEGEDIGKILGEEELNVFIEKLTEENLSSKNADVMVDFTTPMSAVDNIETALNCGVRPVVGTTGFTEEDVSHVKEIVDRQNLSAVIAPNFALGAVLMMKFAAEAAKYFSQAEIVETHHDKKIDAPSGTALKTAELIDKGRKEKPPEREDLMKLDGARGGVEKDVHIHSIRLTGPIAHQEVIFGSTGQTLTIKHDSFHRNSFMPGVVFAVNKVMETKGLVFGLENLLE